MLEVVGSGLRTSKLMLQTVREQTSRNISASHMRSITVKSEATSQHETNQQANSNPKHQPHVHKPDKTAMLNSYPDLLS